MSTVTAYGCELLRARSKHQWEPSPIRARGIRGGKIRDSFRRCLGKFEGVSSNVLGMIPRLAIDSGNRTLQRAVRGQPRDEGLLVCSPLADAEARVL
jgi:hypothetical protein